VGVDLGDKWSNFCILGLDGEKLTEGQLQTTQQDFAELFQSLAPARVVMEVGTHSAWVRDVVAGCGHEVLVANPRQMEGPKRRNRKNDRIDAHKTGARGTDRPAVAIPNQPPECSSTARPGGSASTQCCRGSEEGSDQHHAGAGEKYGWAITQVFDRELLTKVDEALPAEVREALLPLVQLVETLSSCIKGYDGTIEQLGREKYPQTKLLRQVKGVGPITALAYVLTLENPERFSRSRDVGPYLGLVPKQEDSGDRQPQLRITKMGDMMMRQLLVGSAHHILGPFGADTDLRRYGLRLSERGGKNAKKRAVVAVARKLAVLLHRLWVSGEVYEPLHHTLPAATRQEASQQAPVRNREIDRVESFAGKEVHLKMW
jgi:transposase